MVFGAVNSKGPCMDKDLSMLTKGAFSKLRIADNLNN